MEKSPSRWWDFPSAALLVLAILVSTWRLTITDWTPHLGYVSNLALAGTVLGVALGASRFGKLGVRLLIIGYTLTFIPWQLMAFYENDLEIDERLLHIGNRILLAIGQYAADKPVHDEMFPVFLLSSLYWFIGLSSGYALIRHAKYLTAVIPAGAAMIITHQYDLASPGRIWFIAVYLLLALGLLGRQQFLRRRPEWTKNNVLVSPETGQELITAALIAAGSLVLIAWMIPSRISPPLADKWDEITDPWRTTTERMGQAFASVENQPTQSDYRREILTLGNRANLDQTALFTVSVPPEAQALPRLYWRGKVFDHYENAQWTSSENSIEAFLPDTDTFTPPENERRELYRFSFASHVNEQTTLYLPGQPIWVSRPVDARLVELPSGEKDILALLPRPSIDSGETYSTRSTLANPSIRELRAAGQIYPEWVQERYLQLPENFPERIADYAEEITRDLSTPYDKAEAVTSVLREEITYKTSINLPADGGDVIEWFLFEGKEGYCNYYATAEVLMLRSLGIPARLVVGFARGESTSDPLSFIVRNRNAHAWPEVYFPGYGWVEFEPTGNQSPLLRPSGQVAGDSNSTENTPVPQAPSILPDTQLEEPPNTPPSATSSFNRIFVRYFPIIAWSVTPILLIVGLVMLNRRVPLARSAASYLLSASDRRGLQLPAWIKRSALYILLHPVERSFNVVNVSLRWLGKSPALHYTPADRAAALTSLLPEAAEEIETLQSELQASLYSPHSGNTIAARQASRKVLWKCLRKALQQIVA